MTQRTVTFDTATHRIVPRIATPEMIEAGINTPCACATGNDEEDQQQDYIDMFSAMLAAAPDYPESEPVNNQLLDALKDVVSASVNNSSCQRGVVEKCHCLQCSRIRARKTIAAAEQAHEPISDEEIITEFTKRIGLPCDDSCYGLIVEAGRAIEKRVTGENL